MEANIKVLTGYFLTVNYKKLEFLVTLDDIMKKQLFDLEVKGQGPTTHRLMVMHPHTKYH
jgi:hypothetical protein